ncbi:RNA polymerase sigma factor [Sphingobacterium chuzhouense]|uniref:Sigma-70 family RNA polymerase sigma factor n=1 Tax=Sphingobacterium chuzhouense TaxID=1742264 RepID=A0ABR7XX33_9SPHI|nr:sigma-70 family RNA polymerase sigma factor [Sphingobacterium chuzhouense]MBD1423592.1 sigma-70 family RNA polymerase sigma factor [Sphingobacterium chuzhouense]
MEHYRQDDELLWRRFQRGDVEAFTQIVDKYSDVLYDYGVRFSKDSELIKDCIQDIFYVLWNRKENLSEVRSVKFYLMKSLRQKVIREIPKWAQSTPLEQIYDETNFQLNIEIEQESPISPEAQQKFLSYIASLAPRQKELLYLRFYQGLKQDKIAELMQLNRQSVYNLQRSALSALRKVVDYEAVVALMYSIIFLLFLNMYE